MIPPAILNLPNFITFLRIGAIPLFLILLTDKRYTEALVVFVAAGATDSLDGAIARLTNSHTVLGAYIDPLADKCLVICALVALVAKEELWWFPAALLTAREVGISLYRSWAGRRGITVPARKWAKVKTVVEDVAVGFALLPPVAADHKIVPAVFLWVAVVLALWTGAQYLLDGRRLLEGRTVEPRAV